MAKLQKNASLAISEKDAQKLVDGGTPSGVHVFITLPDHLVQSGRSRQVRVPAYEAARHLMEHCRLGA